MDGTPPAGRRTRWRAAALALAVPALLAGCGVGEVPLEEAAATARVWPAEVVAPSPLVPERMPAPVQDGPPRLSPTPTIELPLVPVPDTLDSPLLPPPPYGVSPGTTPLPAPCGGFSSPRRVVPGVVAGPGRATLDWQGGGRASVLSYRVTAVDQQLVTGEQPEPPSVVAAAPADCQPVSVTMTGLRSGAAYVFWMEEETYDVTRDVTQFVQVGSTSPVVVG
jgi:hypothetical protein